MNPERFQQVDRVLQSVLERPAAEREAFLEEACGADSSLKHEVRSLLAAYDESGSFIEQPAIEDGARLMADERGASLIGQVVGNYKIVGHLGAGGMGEVYLASDARNNRPAALKILLAHLTKDPERVRRFQQEARAVLALNHPNVVTIYEIGQEAGVNFIATELIEGETLRRRMTRQPMTVGESLEVAIQIASALVYAHEKGVIHRDIKPENVMLRPDGYVKVLDFGIAKLTEGRVAAEDDPHEARTRMKVETSPGMVMGTVHYMSPEQARGKEIDERTDTWSLGCVLYEMLTGRQPFEGETPSDVIATILKHDPAPLSVLLPDAPPELAHIVSKALDKSKDERYQTAKDFLADLRRFKRHYEREADIERSMPAGEGARLSAQVSTGGQQASATGAGEPATNAASVGHTTSSAEYLVTEFKRHRTGVIVTLAAFVVIAAAGIGAYKFWNRGGSGQTAEGVAHAPKLTPVPVNGNVISGAISPDGKYVVYKLKHDAGDVETSLWLKHLPTDTTVQIIPPTRNYVYEYTFSADSNYIYYMQRSFETEVYSANKISVLGGVPKRLIENIRRADFAPSPDGKQLAFHRVEANGEVELTVANEDGTGERILVTRNNSTEWLDGMPAWSPDGKTIACWAGSYVGGFNLAPLMVNVADGTQRQLGTTKWRLGSGMAWLGDGSGLLLSVGDTARPPRQIWYISYPEGAAHRVTNDLNDYEVESVTADSKTLLAVQTKTANDVWVAPTSGGASQLKQVTFTRGDIVRMGAWTPDGRIVFNSAAGASNHNLWVMNADGSDRRQITSGNEEDYSPSISADGRYVFFTSMRGGGTPHIWRVDINGSNLKRLTPSDTSEDSNAFVTPDGQWVIFNSYRGGKRAVWKVSADGGDPVQLSRSYVIKALSPDGKLMACYDETQQSGRTKVYLLPVEGGEPTKILELPEGADSTTFGWTADGRALAFLLTANGIDNVWTLPLDGGKPAQLTHFNDPSFTNLDIFALSRDGKLLAVTRGNSTSDLVLITDFR